MTSSQLCALTKTSGKFVKSHILPLALTRLERTGDKFVEAGIGLGIKHRSNSWYDNALVTRAGEDILADIDAKGIDILRKHKLVWSGWSNEQELQSDDQVLLDGKPQHRFINIHQARELQIFYLSILWRAAASSRPEFKDFSLNPEELEDLRIKVLNKDPGDFSEYPIQLFQIATLGIHHNRTPLLEQKEMADIEPIQHPIIDYARVYFDGLSAHIHLPRSKRVSPTYLNTCLGNQEGTIVFLHRFEESRAHADMNEMIETVHREHFTPPTPLNTLSSAIKSAWK